MERLLRSATWAAAGLLLAGLLLWLIGLSAAEYLLHAGLWLLISTPVARVLGCAMEFWKARDWRFVALTLVVLGCLFFPIARYFLSSPR